MPNETDASFDPGSVELGADARFGLGVAQAGQNALKNLWDFIKIPGDVAGGKYTLDEISKLAPGYALGLASAGTPVGAATVPESSLGIFGGTRSLSASLTDLAKAQKLEKSGASAEDILNNSGWFRGADSKWRNTISDEGASLNPNVLRKSSLFPEISLLKNNSYTLRDVLSHPDLFSAYPELSDYPVDRISAVHGLAGSFDPATKKLQLAGGEPKNMLSTLLHEAQHATQHLEGFSPGGNIEEFLPKDFYFQPKEIQNQQAYEALQKYKRLAGEVEARAVQEQLERRDWTTPVWQHEGYIPFEEQILKKPHKLVPVDYDPFVGVDQR